MRGDQAFPPSGPPLLKEWRDGRRGRKVFSLGTCQDTIQSVMPVKIRGIPRSKEWLSPGTSFQSVGRGPTSTFSTCELARDADDGAPPAWGARSRGIGPRKLRQMLQYKASAQGTTLEKRFSVSRF